MPEARDLPLFRWGEELRRERLGRKACRRRTLATVALATAATGLLATLLWPPSPKLVWNASASSPIGLYRVHSKGSARIGDIIIAWPPEQARHLGAERHYLPANVPLVKRVAASAGDRVCGIGEAVFVNGRLVALRRAVDPSGRPMPWWTGCEELRGGDLFLLTPGVREAFDGRYFGVTRSDRVVGHAKLLWSR